MLSANASPSGPDVIVSQFMSIDILMNNVWTVDPDWPVAAVACHEVGLKNAKYRRECGLKYY